MPRCKAPDVRGVSRTQKYVATTRVKGNAQMVVFQQPAGENRDETIQLGFYFDPSRCVQCHACEAACKSLHHHEHGMGWRRVVSLWKGKYPEVTHRTVSLSCMHCGEPACMTVCPRGAIEKRTEDGSLWFTKKSASVVTPVCGSAPSARRGSAMTGRCRSAISVLRS